MKNSSDKITKSVNAAGRGGSGPAETTAKLTDLSDLDIVIDMCIVCRHVIICPNVPLVIDFIRV